MKKWMFGLTLLVVVAIGGFVIVEWYSYLFAKTIDGKIESVERVTNPSAIIATGQKVPEAQVFSFAVAVRDAIGEIHTASSEDRQWAVARPGQCAEVKMFPYPPWLLERGGTYFGARLLKLSDCPGPSPAPKSAP